MKSDLLRKFRNADLEASGLESLKTRRKLGITDAIDILQTTEITALE